MKSKVIVQGLGFVGSAMATAVALAENDDGKPLYDVIGVDLPTNAGLRRINAINEGRFPFETNDPKLNPAVARAYAQGNLRATSDESVYSFADFIIVDVDLDIPFRDDEPQLQLDGFKKALRTIGRYMHEEALVIIETTVPPGACEKVVVPTLSEEFIKRRLNPENLLVAHSYERVMPGKDYLDSVINFWRVYSGHSEVAADRCEEFLSSVVNFREYPLTRLSSTTASETAKVMENTYRAANIAFICEWTRYAEKVGIDLYEIVSAIQKRPTHANIRYPGLGIGGYCLTKDPTFTPASAKQLFGLDLSFPFSKLAVTESAKMPYHGVARLIEMLGGEIDGKRILLCGVSYREDVADTRYSPSETVYQELVGHGALVDVHDPFVGWWEELCLEVPKVLPKSDVYDGVLFAVPHFEYRELDLVSWITDKDQTAILDGYLVFSAEKRRAFQHAGIRIGAIGVGSE